MSLAKLNGNMATRSTVVLPRTGIWTAIVLIAHVAAKLTGDATLELGDAVFHGTITGGGDHAGEGWYRVVGGKAGWRKIIPAMSFRAEGGIKLSTVLNAAAKESGEKLAPFTDRRIGTSFVHPESEASSVLDRLAEDDWFVGEDGLTYIGVRAASTYPIRHHLIEKRLDRRTVTVTTEEIKHIVPGFQLEGFEAASIRHELGAEGLRTFIQGTVGLSPTDRLLQSMRSVVRAIMRESWYHGRYEYRVQAFVGGYLDLIPARKADGLPKLSNIPMRIGMPGGRGEPTVGSIVEVTFANGDSTQPYVTGYSGQVEPGAQPPKAAILVQTLLELGSAGGPSCARKTDTVNCGYLVFAAASGTGLDSYYPGTTAGKAAADSRVSALGGPPAYRFDLNTGGGDPDASGGGQITSGSTKVKVG